MGCCITWTLAGKALLLSLSCYQYLWTTTHLCSLKDRPLAFFQLPLPWGPCSIQTTWPRFPLLWGLQQETTPWASLGHTLSATAQEEQIQPCLPRTPWKEIFDTYQPVFFCPLQSNIFPFLCLLSANQPRAHTVKPMRQVSHPDASFWIEVFISEAVRSVACWWLTSMFLSRYYPHLRRTASPMLQAPYGQSSSMLGWSQSRKV